MTNDHVFDLDARAQHTSQNVCSTDDAGGWVSVAISRRE